MQSRMQVMHSRTQVAQYAGRMAVELRNMCREVQLHDLAYLFEVAASEAEQVRPLNRGNHQPCRLAAVTDSAVASG